MFSVDVKNTFYALIPYGLETSLQSANDGKKKIVVTKIEQAIDDRNGVYLGITMMACGAIMHPFSASALPLVLFGSMGFCTAALEGKRLHDTLSEVFNCRIY